METVVNTEKDIQLLAERWDSLRFEVFKRGTVNMEVFEPLFSDTYTALKGLRQEAQIDRMYLPLVLNAAAYSKTTPLKEDVRADATFILTERMLQSCVLGGETSSYDAERASIYSLDERREIFVYFSEVDYAITEIVRVIESNRALR